MCQLWLNLPAKDKMHPPRYQPITAKDIPTAPMKASGSIKDGEKNVVKVIAGVLFVILEVVFTRARRKMF